MMVNRVAYFLLSFSAIPVAAMAEEPLEESSAKLLSTPPVSSAALLETLLGLILVLGIIFVLAWLIKRTNRFQTSINGEMKIIAGLPLGPRERAVLLQVGEQQILVGVTAQHVQTLHILETPIPVDANKFKPINFADKLQQIIKQREQS